jgi:transcriptional regulator with XRE-family HTH domain
MARATDPSLNRRRLRIELRKAREDAGLSQRTAAEAVEWSLSKLMRIEAGTVGISVTDLRALLQQYDVTDPALTEELVTAARRSKGQPWWNRYADVVTPHFGQYLGYEAAATSLRTYHPVIIPGLLQTSDYATAILADRVPESRARMIVDLRMERQENLLESDADDAPEMSFIVDEAALHRWIGGPKVMARQLQHLREMAAHPKVELLVLPYTAGAHFALTRTYLLLGFKDDDDALYMENQAGSLVSRDEHDLIVRYQEAFEASRSASYAGDEAVGFIDSVAQEFTVGGTPGGGQGRHRD